MDDVHGRSRAIHVQDTVTLFRRCCGTTDQKPAIEPRRNLAVAVDIHRAAILHSNGRLPVYADQRDSGGRLDHRRRTGSGSIPAH